MPQIHFGKSKMGVTNTAMEVQAVLNSWLHLCLCVAETGLVWESLSSLEVEGTGAKQDLQKCLHNDGLGSAALVLLLWALSCRGREGVECLQSGFLRK